MGNVAAAISCHLLPPGWNDQLGTQATARIQGWPGLLPPKLGLFGSERGFRGYLVTLGYRPASGVFAPDQPRLLLGTQWVSVFPVLRMDLDISTTGHMHACLLKRCSDSCA